MAYRDQGENAPGMTRSMLGMVNPFNPSTMMSELKYQYFMRPSMYANAAVRGMRWSGLFGFRTIATGRAGATAMLGGRGPGEFGMLGGMANALINTPFSGALNALGRAYGGVNANASQFLTKWSGAIGQHGIIGGLAKATGDNSVINAIAAFLGGREGLFQPAMLGRAGGTVYKKAVMKGPAGAGQFIAPGLAGKTTASALKTQFADDVANIIADYEGKKISTIFGGTKKMREGIASALRAKGWHEDVAFRMSKQFSVKRIAIPAVAGAAVKLGNVALVGTLLSQAAYGLTSAAAGVVKNVTPALNQIGSPAFGGGNLGRSFVNSMASTMRQRALSEMRGSVIGTRSLLGNEAALYSD